MRELSHDQGANKTEEVSHFCPDYMNKEELKSSLPHNFRDGYSIKYDPPSNRYQ